MRDEEIARFLKIEEEFVKHARFIESFKERREAFSIIYERKGKRYTWSGMQGEIAADRWKRALRIIERAKGIK